MGYFHLGKLWEELFENSLYLVVNPGNDVVFRLYLRTKVIGSTPSTKRDSVVLCALPVNNQVSIVGKRDPWFQADLIEKIRCNRFGCNHERVDRD